MDLRVTVNFGCATNKETSLGTLRQSEHVQGSHERGLDSLDRVELIMGRRRRARKMVNLVTFNHEGLNDVVTNHLKVGMANPVADSGFRASEEVVQDGDFMTKEHQTVNEMRANEAGASGNEDALAVGWSKEPNGGETSESRVRDRVGIRVINRLGLILSVPLGKLGMLGLLVIGRGRRNTLARRRDIMRTQIESTKVVDGDLAVESKSIESDRSDLFAVLVQGHDAGRSHGGGKETRKGAPVKGQRNKGGCLPLFPSVFRPVCDSCQLTIANFFLCVFFRCPDPDFSHVHTPTTNSERYICIFT